MTKKKTTKTFDKYKYYMDSVQAPEEDVKFFLKSYKEIKKKKPKSLREDFCGTYSVCCEWVKLDKTFESYGIDLDPEPLNYGHKNIVTKIKPEEKKRIKIYEKNVMAKKLPETDIVVAQNFSYYLFKQRSDLLKYFTNVYNTMKKDGLFIIDCFGGHETQQPNEEETEHDGFSYYWDQDSFNPINNNAQFYIHFQRDGEKKREKVFSYDWRMWDIPELRDILHEAGFSKTHVYWEGTTDDGEGDGEFFITEKGEDCEAWVSYIASER